MPDDPLRRLEALQKGIKRRIVVAFREPSILFRYQQRDVGIFGMRQIERFLQEKLDNGAAMYTAVLVDREKKQDAGFVTVTYNRDTSFGEIEMLYLLEEYRGQGMGKKLFKMALSCLDINCIRDRKLCVTYGNEAALRLYESFGFYPFTIDCLQKRG